MSMAISPMISRKSGWRPFKSPWPAWYQPPIMPKAYFKRTSATSLIAAACQFAHISIEEFRSPNRTRDYARARFAVAYVLKRYRPDLSYPQIARMLGRKDHTTILHAVAEAKKLRRSNDDFAALCLHLEGVANGVFAE
jgi:chromosomal replication initiation ATPase DnaA